MQKLFEFDEHIGAWRVLVQTRDIQSGAVSTRCLADEAVTEDKLADGSVTGIKIGTGAVTEDKIADGAIDSIHIKSNTVSGEKLADEAIESRHIKDNSIGAEKIKDGTIENVDIKDGTLDGSKIKDGTIEGAKMADNAIESRHLIDNSIPGSKIKDGTIENVDIKDGTLDGSKIKDNTIQGGKLADGAISNSKIVDGSVTESKIGTGAVTESKVGTGAVTESKIGTGAVTENKISDGAVTENKLAPGAVTTDKLSDGVISELQTITDAVPTASSVKPVQSGGTLDSIIKHGSAFDLSAYNSGTTYADLTAALTALNSLPSTFKKGGMSFKYVQTSDNKYIRYNLTADEFTTDVTKWAIDDVGVYVENPEFVYVKTDREGKILWAIKTDGSIYYGAGVPQQVKDYIQAKIDELVGTGDVTEIIDSLNEIISFLDQFKNTETLAEILKTMEDDYNGKIEAIDSKKVDKVEDKSLINSEYADTITSTDNPEWFQITTDSKDKVLEGTKKDGSKYIGGDTEINGHLHLNSNFQVQGTVSYQGGTYSVCTSPEYVYALLDSQEKVILGIKTDGKVYADIASLGDNNNICQLLGLNPSICDKLLYIGDFNGISTQTAPNLLQLYDNSKVGRLSIIDWGTGLYMYGFNTIPDIETNNELPFNINHLSYRDLIQFDYDSIFIKYQDEKPNNIERIVIAKGNCSFSKLEKDVLASSLCLPTFRDNVLNPNGTVKSNRGICKSVYSNIIASPMFQDSSHWNAGGAWTVTNNVAHCYDPNGNMTSLTQVVHFEKGYKYKMVFVIQNYVSGKIQYRIDWDTYESVGYSGNSFIESEFIYTGVGTHPSELMFRPMNDGFVGDIIFVEIVKIIE